jgi:LytR cell envelope-related transcriptional attenuator/LytR_cpsA_psr family
VSTYATIDLKPGYQRLNGSNALDFVRYRHTDSDLYRVARQQAFVKAFKEQVTQSFSPLKLPRLIDAVTSNVQLGQAGNRPISGKTILSYALFGYGLPSGHFFQPRIDDLQPAGPYGAELSAQPGEVQKAVQQFEHPDPEAPVKATEVALGRRLRTHVVRPQDVSLVVLNGNGVTGSASNASYELAQRRYQVIVPPDPLDRNAPTYDYFHTAVYYDAARPKAKAAARQVANLFGDADVAAVPRKLRRLASGAMLVVVVGRTFHGTIARAPVDQTPKRQPPAVADNPGLTIPLLRSVRRQTPFPLYYPRLIEKSSSLDSAEPIHAYRIVKGHRAVRLVFRMGDDFWGIEETDWKDAPILQGANFEHTIKGRKYDLYYSGPHLHMIVLRRGAASYWVVNTLLDSLSNETMLAIAKSLRPLGT